MQEYSQGTYRLSWTRHLLVGAISAICKHTVRTCLRQLTKQSHHKIHLAAILELSAKTHGFLNGWRLLHMQSSCYQRSSNLIWSEHFKLPIIDFSGHRLWKKTSPFKLIWGTCYQTVSYSHIQQMWSQITIHLSCFCSSDESNIHFFLPLFTKSWGTYLYLPISIYLLHVRLYISVRVQWVYQTIFAVKAACCGTLWEWWKWTITYWKTDEWTVNLNCI